VEVASIIQKKVVSPNDFAGLDELSRTQLAFVDRYNQTARPFNWKFIAADLAALLADQRPRATGPAARGATRGSLMTPDEITTAPN
jgi:hypothetical protein